MTSIVRENLMTRPGYTPYCGDIKWPGRHAAHALCERAVSVQLRMAFIVRARVHCGLRRSETVRSMTQTVPTKLPRKIVVALNKRHISDKQKLRNAAKKAGK